ncbi:MAG TPA: hypothetical protein VFY71_13590 [Planctomycetota bacterium]|nr:hypothetical protein [Planctomycetota bacterium]
MTPSDPDPLSALLALSVAEREDAVASLCESLGAEADGLHRLRRLRSLVDRKLRAQARSGSSERPSRWGPSGRKPPGPGPPA